jgi:hypothetical protein
MCNCGRKAPQVVTSAQAQAEADARAAEDFAVNEAQRVVSAQNALANASAGWFTIEEPASQDV